MDRSWILRLVFMDVVVEDFFGQDLQDEHDKGIQILFIMLILSKITAAKTF